MKTKYVFTPEVDDQIRKLYQNKVGMKSVAYKGYVRDLAEKLNMPRWRVSRRAAELGLLPVQKKEPVWAEKELKILERHAHKTPPRIQIHLKKAGYQRSQQGIFLKRKRMRFLRNLNGYSARSVALCFGIDDHSVVRWVEQGWLKAKRRGTERTINDHYLIKNKWIRKFIKENVAVIDFRKVDKYWLVDLLTVKDF